MSTVTRTGKLDTRLARLENGVKRGLIEGAMVVAQRATQKAPRDTGRLKRSITHSMPTEIGLTAWYITVGTNVVYAAIQEFGGNIQLPRITAKNKKALAFDWPGAPASLKPSKTGKYVFKSVAGHIINIKAQPYLRPALRESKQIIEQLILKNVIAALSK